MRIAKRRCRYCRGWFEPDARAARFQKTCGRDECRREQRRRKLKYWRALHPARAKHYQPKVRAWAKAYPNYWRRYRAGHPEYVARDNLRRTRARRRDKLSANETAIPIVIVEKLQALGAAGPCDVSAKETPMIRRVEAIEDCLRSTVATLWSAKQTPIASGLSTTG